MATTASETQVQELYIAYFGRPADPAGLAFYADQLDAGTTTVADIATSFSSSAEAQAIIALDTDAFLEAVYQQAFARAYDSAAGADGTFWADAINAGTTTKELAMVQIITGTPAGSNDEAAVANKVAVATTYTAAVEADGKDYSGAAAAAAAAVLAGVASDAATVTAGNAAAQVAVNALGTVGTVGNTIFLTSGTDRDGEFNGTDDNDTFNAYIQQNAFAGGVSNSLSTADHLDGGAGTDTLAAELVEEFIGTNSGDNNDIQPRTTSIEIVTFDALDDDQTTTVDAKNMTGLDKIGSYFSDGDLVIENLTTLTDDGALRNTDALTITMDHTDNMNSDEDASNLTVLFDEDYLVAGEQTAGATLTIRMVNAVQNEAGNNSVEGFSSITFKVGTTEVVVDITSVSTNAALDFTTVYDAVAALINAQLVADGITTVTASAPALENAVFSIPVAGFTTGDDAGDYFPIILINTGSEVLSGVEIATSDLQLDTDLNNSFSTTNPNTQDIPLSVNIELEKVGRDGEGGNLVIGGKNNDTFGDTDEDQRDGIAQFNIEVLGDAAKPSNLGQIISTNDALKTVIIASEARADASYASLTVRGETAGGSNATPFGGTLDTLNANTFFGDLTIGTAGFRDALNIDTFTATGGGDVTYWAEYTNTGGFPSLNDNVFTTTTAAGSDTFVSDINDGAQLTITSGEGDDSITASIDGGDDSGSTLSKLFAVSTGGDNTVITTSGDSAHEADITLGGGADTVTGNSVNITVDTNAGNDVIYAENTGVKAIATLVADVYAGVSIAAGAAGAAITANMNQAQFLNGREVTVTVAMPEETTAAAAEAVRYVNGYEIVFDFNSAEALSTERELYVAVANAINGDDVVNKLVSAAVNSKGNLIVTYLVDGSTVASEELVEINISDEYAVAADIPATLLAAVQEELSDSTITATQVLAAYDDDTPDNYAVVISAGGDSTSSADNSVNGGTGDDVIVLSSNDAATDTVVFDAGNFGNDVIVHFEVDATGDILDFSAFLNNVETAAGSTSSVSATRVDGTAQFIATMIENSVAVTDMSAIADNDAGAGTALTFATLTDAGLLTEMNATAEFGSSSASGTFVGTVINSIMMVEDALNNEGFYNVYEVEYTEGTTNAFTSVVLVGTVDFGETQLAFVDATIL